MPAASNNREPHRPQFHFTPPAHWMNDPNGLVYSNGEYHLFYQCYPHSSVWGPMHWGHAVSRDLVHWQHLPIALYPEGDDYVFSGSAAIDTANSAGFGASAMIAMYTNHDMRAERAGRKDRESQHLAVSLDAGRNWRKYLGNPVLPNPGAVQDFRDPKLIWHAPTRRWVAALTAGTHAEFWGSPDMKTWLKLGEFGREFGCHQGVWECPDLFPLPVQGGAAGEQKWVLLQSINPGAPNGGSGTQYFVGDFDGRQFTIDEACARELSAGHALWLDHGRDNYAGVTWGDAPDNRRILIAWMSNWDYATKVPTAAWRSAMSLPVELSLHRTPLGYRLHTAPVRELERLRQRTCELPAALLSGRIDLNATGGLDTRLAEWELEFELPGDGVGAGQGGTAASAASGVAGLRFGLELSNTRDERYRIGYDVTGGRYYSDRRRSGKLGFSDRFATSEHYAPRTRSERTLRMRLFADVASMELFADDGATQMTEIFFPSDDYTRAALYAEGGTVQLKSARAHQLARIWPE